MSLQITSKSDPYALSMILTNELAEGYPTISKSELGEMYYLYCDYILELKHTHFN